MNSIHPYWFIAGSLGLAVLPLFFAFVSSYLKVSILFGLLRSGLGAQQIPGNLVIMALSIGITLAVMAPVLEESIGELQTLDTSMLEKQPEASGEEMEKVQKILKPWLIFMEQHSGEREIAVFKRVAERKRIETTPETKDEIKQEGEPAQLSILVLLPAYLLSELKEAFAMGFVLLLPFVAIDLIVANILVGLGMFMVSPVIIALPLKLLVFIVADGWLLMTRSIISSYVVGG